MVAVENTPELHNVVVCTLCSCYPWPVLGLPPAWYKSPQYRSRMVAQPRALLAEMGLDCPIGCASGYGTTRRKPGTWWCRSAHQTPSTCEVGTGGRSPETQ